MKPIVIITAIIFLLILSGIGFALTISDTWTDKETVSDKVSNMISGETIPDESTPKDIIPSDEIDTTTVNEEIDITTPDKITTEDELLTTTENDNTIITDTTTPTDTTKTIPTAPLNAISTSIRIKSSLPLSNAFWGYDMTPKYVYLANARIITHQDSFEIGEKDYKIETKTQSKGYTPFIPLEEQSYSEWDGVKGKMKIYIQHPDIISETGAVSIITNAPTTKNGVKVISLIPDTYAISTILKKVDNTGLILPFYDRDSAASIGIVELNACTGATSKDWVLASLFSYDPVIDIYLSTSEYGNWKRQSFITKDAFDENNQMHVVLHPQILTTENEYTGANPYDIHTRGSKEFYVKFDIGGTEDKIFKISFDVTSSKLTNLIYTDVS